MGSPASQVPLVLRLPGLRRYGAEIDRLRRRLDGAERQIRNLKEADAKHRQAGERHREHAIELSRDLARTVKKLDQTRKEVAEIRVLADAGIWEETLRKAIRFEHFAVRSYYWYNAEKKIDLYDIEPFGSIASRVRRQKRTFLHLDRLYTLWQAVASLPPQPCAIAEVGAYRGGSARFIAEAMRAHGRELPFYVCDTFQGHVVVNKAVDGRHKVAKQFSSTSVDRVTRYLDKFENVRVLDGDIRETSERLKGEQFGLVHIDVDVYPITQFCLEFFGSRMVPGGTIVVDDYGFTTCAGVKKAVDEFVATHRHFRMLHLITGQAVVIPISRNPPG